VRYDIRHIAKTVELLGKISVQKHDCKIGAKYSTRLPNMMGFLVRYPVLVNTLTNSEFTSPQRASVLDTYDVSRILLRRTRDRV
jgi:hypothetical protein